MNIFYDQTEEQNSLVIELIGHCLELTNLCLACIACWRTPLVTITVCFIHLFISFCPFLQIYEQPSAG